MVRSTGKTTLKITFLNYLLNQVDFSDIFLVNLTIS